ncbi:MAG: metallophosphoesterase family protein [Candidatus Lindowbacteria bacterium]|nr:metallophosphoesterase family protein [Candidatus Lindowbacteria bacterium]
MRFAIISDIHSNLHALTAVLEEVDRLKPDSIFSLGDLVGYNAFPSEVLDVLFQNKIPSIMGNHDIVCCGLENPIWFNAVAREASLWTRKRLSEEKKRYLCKLPNEKAIHDRIYAVHGSPMSRDDYIMDLMDALNCFQHLPDKSIRICLYGHTHLPAIYSDQGPSHDTAHAGKHLLATRNRYFINPGSVGQPRDGDPRASFAILDIEELSIEIIRVEYDVTAAMKSVLKAGLPHFLAERLQVGA